MSDCNTCFQGVVLVQCSRCDDDPRWGHCHWCGDTGDEIADGCPVCDTMIGDLFEMSRSVQVEALADA